MKIDINKMHLIKKEGTEAFEYASCEHITEVILEHIQDHLEDCPPIDFMNLKLGNITYVDEHGEVQTIIGNDGLYFIRN